MGAFARTIERIRASISKRKPSQNLFWDGFFYQKIKTHINPEIAK